MEVNRLQLRRFVAPASAGLLSAFLLAGCGAAGQPNTGNGAGAGTTNGNAGTTTGTGNLGNQAKSSANRVKSAGNTAAHKVTSKANNSTKSSTSSTSGKPKGDKGKSGGKGGKGGKATSAMAAVNITPAMAVQGASLFRSEGCTSCHGPQGSGTSAAPALNGTGSVPILSTYPTPASLATFIHANMPLTNPGSLTATQADELAAYVFYTLNHGKPSVAATSHGG